MNYYLLANIIVCIFAFVGFVYGAMQFFRHGKALYGQMITFALLCVVIGRIFNIARILSGVNFIGSFQLGTLGIIGSFMFFYTSNYGTLDSIVDDGTKEFLKYRLIAMVAPVVVIGLYFPLFFLGDVTKIWKVQGAVLLFFMALCSYFHLKHLVITDVEFGVIKNLRPYNLLALLYMMSSIAECYAMSRNNSVMTLVSTCFSAVFLVLMIPLISRGLKKSFKRKRNG